MNGGDRPADPTSPPHAGLAARERQVRRTLLVEGLANLLVLVAKTAVGVATSSAAVIGDAVHSLADLANNAVALVALRLAVAPPDREHPYGHRRYESLAVFLLATLLAVLAVEVALRSLETRDFVHVLALPAGGDWQAVVSAVEPIAGDADASAAVRALAAERIARDLGIEAERVAVGRRGRIPTVEIDGAPSTMAISLSHHGRFVACAISVRCEAAELPEVARDPLRDASRRAEEPVGRHEDTDGGARFEAIRGPRVSAGGVSR